MKKNLIIALALVFVLSIAGTAFAAPNPFVDVPAKHWAYDAINTLAKNKIIDGYGDGTFRGDRTMTRYEMAQIVAKAVARSDKADAANKALIDKLQVEFAAELQNLGVRVDKLEKKMGSVQFSGDARVRYIKNFDLSGTNAQNNNGSPARFQERVRLNATAQIDDNWSFQGRFGAQNTVDKNDWVDQRATNNGQFYFDRMVFTYKPSSNKNWSFGVGRQAVWLGQGMTYDYFIDGFSVKYASDNFKGTFWVGDNSATVGMWGTGLGPNDNQNQAIINLDWNLSKNVNVTTSYQKNISRTYPVKVWTFGANAKLGPDFKLTAEWAKNYYDFTDTEGSDYDSNAKKTAWWTELQYKAVDANKPGTWDARIAYKNVGKDAFDGNLTTWVYGGSMLNGSNAGSDTNYGTYYGFKGWEFNFNYAFAKGAYINLGVASYKPQADNTTFDKYNTAYHAITYFNF
ncbi:MAG TPA: S-layer homology domain-containing protein [Patescibacteria group bacterium]|nr:S-layer homology domain-containing protein [Patescibacteria group bacterium]